MLVYCKFCHTHLGFFLSCNVLLIKSSCSSCVVGLLGNISSQPLKCRKMLRIQKFVFDLLKISTGFE